MFHQVVAFRWVERTWPESKRGLRDALERLREIPELVAMTLEDDAGHVDGNFDFVVVMDFADFASARRYVDHPRLLTHTSAGSCPGEWHP